ncbi:unnamed protein product [Mytilus coruscus]|uniref:Uncharacterized protein n=1 Tax=Mytilus coruscus TaxID=42192 RepID=A0A6J8CS51_MYTCO|nr:unnamed protein product [Mytilus coruscus]
MEEYRLSFLLRSVNDELPSQSNLYMWGLIKDPTCTLCKIKPATLQDVLSSFPVALKDGRYTWRYDSVLKTIASRLDIIRRKKRKLKKNITFANFVKAGESKRQHIKRTWDSCNNNSLADDCRHTAMHDLSRNSSNIAKTTYCALVTGCSGHRKQGRQSGWN